MKNTTLRAASTSAGSSGTRSASSSSGSGSYSSTSRAVSQPLDNHSHQGMTDLGDDLKILFDGQEARITQFGAPAFSMKSSGFDSPPAKSNRSSENTVAQGMLKVYKILGKKAAFIQCGHGFIRPILPRSRLWRTNVYEFILPQPNPGKYWRIELLSPDIDGDGVCRALDGLESAFKTTCMYRNEYRPLEDLDSDFSDSDLPMSPPKSPQSPKSGLRRTPLKNAPPWLSDSPRTGDPPSPTPMRRQRPFEGGHDDSSGASNVKKSKHVEGKPAIEKENNKTPNTDKNNDTINTNKDISASTTSSPPSSSSSDASLDLKPNMMPPHSPSPASPTTATITATTPPVETFSSYPSSATSTLDAILDSFIQDPMAVNVTPRGRLGSMGSLGSLGSLGSASLSPSDLFAHTSLDNEHLIADISGNTDTTEINNNNNSNLGDNMSDITTPTVATSGTDLTNQTPQSSLHGDHTETDLETETDSHSYVVHNSPMSPSTPYLCHPLIPLAQRNNIISSTYPLRFRPMDDDWLDIQCYGSTPSHKNGANQFGVQPSGLHAAWKGSLTLASQMTGDLFFTSSSYLSNKASQYGLRTPFIFGPQQRNERSFAIDSLWPIYNGLTYSTNSSTNSSTNTSTTSTNSSTGTIGGLSDGSDISDPDAGGSFVGIGSWIMSKFIPWRV